jgi:hypothetical protein
VADCSGGKSRDVRVIGIPQFPRCLDLYLISFYHDLIYKDAKEAVFILKELHVQ